LGVGAAAVRLAEPRLEAALRTVGSARVREEEVVVDGVAASDLAALGTVTLLTPA